MGHFKTGFAGNKNREINFLFEVEIARDQSGQLGFILSESLPHPIQIIKIM